MQLPKIEFAELVILASIFNALISHTISSAVMFLGALALLGVREWLKYERDESIEACAERIKQLESKVETLMIHKGLGR